MAKVTFIPKACVAFQPDDTLLISISEPEGDDDLSFLDRFIEEPLCLKFDDVDQEIPGYRTFDYLLALRFFKWLRNQPVDQDIVVHCAAGISRSAAIAKFMIDKLNYELGHDERSSNDYSRYNRWVYRQLEIVHIDLRQQSASYRDFLNQRGKHAQ